MINSLSKDEIRSFGYQIIDLIADDISATDIRPPWPSQENAQRVKSYFNEAIPEHGTSVNELMDLISSVVLPASPNHNHPDIFAHVNASSIVTSALVDTIVSSLRLYTYNWSMSPASTQIELCVIRWLGQFIGYNNDSAGYVASGGTTANLSALLTARTVQVGPTINRDGVYSTKQLTAYVSESGHGCLDQSFRMMGLGDSSLRKIPVDSDFKIRVDLLRQKINDDIAQGCQPFCIIGIAGSTDTGSVDDLLALSLVAKEYDLWFHIDGAYGAFAASTESDKDKFIGLTEADSVVCDPHKWLNIPLGVGVLLVKDWNHLKETFSIEISTLKSVNSSLDHNQWEYGFELTKSDRALKVWFAIKQYGSKSFQEMIQYHIDLTQYLAEKIRETKSLNLFIEPNLSICCFRYCVPDLDNQGIDDLNALIAKKICLDGNSVISTTVINGRLVLRSCIVSSKITENNVDELLGRVVEYGDLLSAEVAEQ